jgi:polyisoprenoid-binding protein YceI
MLKKSVLAVLLFSTIGAAQVNTLRQYPIDANHSTVRFSVSIMGGLSRVNGKFTEFAVTLMNDDKDITKSSVSVVIKAASINTGITARDNDLRSAGFFDVEKYPEITFQNKHIEKKGKQLLAIGTFTMIAWRLGNSSRHTPIAPIVAMRRVRWLSLQQTPTSSCI